MHNRIRYALWRESMTAPTAPVTTPASVANCERPSRPWAVVLVLVAACQSNGQPNETASSDAGGVDHEGDGASESSLASDGSADRFAPSGIDGGSLSDGAPDAPTIGDGAGDALGPDAQPVTTVQCGPSLCGVDDGGVYLVCCTTDLGVTGSCVSLSAPCANPYPFYCGGPENCIATASCCAFGGGSSCLPIGSCAGANGTILCHDAGDCAAGEACCPLSAGSSFRNCVAAPCP
jgi:hypothetical protein